MLPLPDGLDWETWAAQFVEEFQIEGIPRLLPWREFVDRIQVFSASLPELPRHEQFADWRAWARRAMELLA